MHKILLRSRIHADTHLQVEMQHEGLIISIVIIMIIIVIIVIIAITWNVDSFKSTMLVVLQPTRQTSAQLWKVQVQVLCGTWRVSGGSVSASVRQVSVRMCQ